MAFKEGIVRARVGEIFGTGAMMVESSWGAKSG